MTKQFLQSVIVALSLLSVSGVGADAQQQKSSKPPKRDQYRNELCPYGEAACFKFLTEKQKMPANAAAKKCEVNCR